MLSSVFYLWLPIYWWWKSRDWECVAVRPRWNGEPCCPEPLLHQRCLSVARKVCKTCQGWQFVTVTNVTMRKCIQSHITNKRTFKCRNNFSQIANLIVSKIDSSRNKLTVHREQLCAKWQTMKRHIPLGWVRCCTVGRQHPIPFPYLGLETRNKSESVSLDICQPGFLGGSCPIHCPYRPPSSGKR